MRRTLPHRVQTLEQRLFPSREGRRARWDLTCFTDEELEALLPLAEKWEAAAESVVRTVAELALLERLGTAYQDRCPSAA
jgi:hypothetical protein